METLHGSQEWKRMSTEDGTVCLRLNYCTFDRKMNSIKSNWCFGVFIYNSDVDKSQQNLVFVCFYSFIDFFHKIDSSNWEKMDIRVQETGLDMSGQSDQNSRYWFQISSFLPFYWVAPLSNTAQKNSTGSNTLLCAFLLIKPKLEQVKGSHTAHFTFHLLLPIHWKLPEHILKTSKVRRLGSNLMLLLIW